jgi:microcystin-dependent protein
MSQPYVGQIVMFAGNFAPVGWAFCDGTLLPISENEVLFNLIGTTYGGDGVNTFALPDLRGRVPIHMGTGAGLSAYTLAQTGGQETVTLTIDQLAQHSHALNASTDPAGSTGTPADALATSTTVNVYGDGSGGLDAVMSPLHTVGGNHAHDNMAPYLGVNFIISLFGVFPSPT